MSRRTMPYHRRYHIDALHGYRGLTLEQRGAYTTLLDLIYDGGGPIDNNERWIAGHLNVTVRRAQKLVDELIELRKIYVTSRGQISNHRCEQEIETALKISKKRSESAKKQNDNQPEFPKKPRNFNGRAEHLPSKSPVIPIPELYTSSYTESYRPDGEEREPDIEAYLDGRSVQIDPQFPAATTAAGKHLVAALERSSREGRGDLHALIASRRRRH
jgi:uncharacterized protein YdaU (DUF1376 family)